MKSNRKKKLLVTASTFPRWEGDTEPRFVLDLCAHMTNEFDVTVLAPAAPGAKNREYLEGVEVIRYHYFPIHKWETLCYPGAIVPRIKEKKIRALLVPFLFISLYFHLLRLLPRYDVVHAHWLVPQGIVQSFYKKPYIVTGHGGDVASLNRGIVKTLKIRCLRKADHVTVVSERWKQKVKELVPELEPSVISMGVDTSKFGKQNYRSNLWNQGNRKVVLFVGRLVEIKGVTYLIDAMNNIDALLVIVGDGPLRKELEQQAKEVNDIFGMEKIIFSGTKTHEELKVIFASADVFVVPSITIKDGAQEGVPTAIMEAMASGVAVVASSTGGITEVVHNMQNGILVQEKNSEEIANAVKTLLEEETLYNKLIQNGRATAKNHDYNNIAQKYCSLLKGVIK